MPTSNNDDSSGMTDAAQADAPDSAQMAAMLRAMAPESYDAALAGLKRAALGLVGLLLGAIACMTAPAASIALGFLLAALAVPLFALRWWRAGWLPRTGMAGALIGAALLLGAAATSLALDAMWWGAVALAGALILFVLSAQLAWRAWNRLGALRTLITPSMLASGARGQS